jgi:HupH hydrogenase expression protein
MAGAMPHVIPILPAHRRPADRVLAELLALLSSLAAGGSGGTIDLPSRGMTPDEAAELRERLGRGEVAASITALGETRVHETAYAGVWWLSHRNAEGAVISETIEVTDCPELLRSPREDIAESVVRLQTIPHRY